MLRFLISSMVAVSVYSLSYVCTFQNKDYYGNDELAFQLPKHTIPVSVDKCSTDCTPYEPFTMNGNKVWVGYQSLCSFKPLHLDEYELDDEVNASHLSAIGLLQEGVYVSYPSTTICVSKVNPC